MTNEERIKNLEKRVIDLEGQTGWLAKELEKLKDALKGEPPTAS